ncbi:Cholesterol 7-alpha-monooxygenase 4 [Colletotrichum chlorophyti]|uniref:Cholesterol 7-alpha-monooxygenase 4 n=1 Tax=Colletotrichum chlorophyti TaxID=708187 RepID=A0A1Q8RND6_9PEZI|nr:Cholesterol 7-alpha-monooxygenase 4 [Colletotrichum chlorophyti]
MASINASEYSPTWKQHVTPSSFAWVLLPLLVIFGIQRVFRQKANEPPSLPGFIPYVSTTYQYLTDNSKFLQKATEALKKSSIVKFNLGLDTVYLVTGSRNVQKLFRNSTTNTLSSDKFVIMVNEKVQGMTKEDVAKLVNDRSGRLQNPAPGTENFPEHKRVWAGIHHVFTEHLFRAEANTRLAQSFVTFFSERLEQQPLGKWQTVQIFKYLKKDMAEAATISLAGRKLVEEYPEFVELLWEFDEYLMQLMYGLPSWLNPKPKQVQDKALAMMSKFLTDAWSTFDWDGPDADADWEPIFGSRLQREHSKFYKENGFSLRSRAGVHVGSISGFNSNSLPQAAWAIMEVAKDPYLFGAVREELQDALSIDPGTGEPTFDMTKLVTLPLLQSIYTETLRMHVSINITRQVLEPMELDGYLLSKGSLVQAPTQIGHLDESVWAVDGHSASEFWAERHVKYVESKDDVGNVQRNREFSMAGRPSHFFPYGGGVSMCPGRIFAKQEIMLAVAMVVCRFDIEFVDWVMEDGSRSDRPAMNDKSYVGAGAVPPDRDMKIRWKRLW